ncbi:CRISPR system precrRNA processing endoribonuclease RAMP protein Cas6 [candidate division GN15 bacterium]|nr:CRISPR system precrRNA processing endoribonuclease RAMP protein Cas6 [candidate division GN15 bacterium]
MIEPSPLRLAAVQVTAVVERPIWWQSFPGSVIHGVLGHRLKLGSCVVPHRNCKRCYLVHDCAYGQSFISPVPEDSERMRQYPQTPHPIQLAVFPWEEQRLLPGSELTIALTLYGCMSGSLLKILLALHDALSGGVGRAERGERGTARMLAVTDRVTGRRYDWMDLQRSYTPPAEPIVLGSLGNGDQPRDIEIEFKTPVRLRTGGRMNFEPTLPDLVSNLSRRLANLEYFFGDGDCVINRGEVLDQASEVAAKIDVAKVPGIRYSARQKTTVAVSGFVGRVRVPACPAELARVLEQGQYTGLGKGTTMGLGWIEAVHRTE